MRDARPSTTYRDAGVDQAAADALVGFFSQQAARTRDGAPQLGGFAGLFPLSDVLGRYELPVLASSTDTVGTKIDLLRRAGHHRTAGWDCVAMNVDDVVCSGAEPLFFVDCVAIERLEADVVKEIVAGVADACVESGCELVGGETAQLPGLLAPDAYEVMGTCIGVVEADGVWGPERVRAGDAIVGLASSGPHSNGFSLIRRVLGDAEPHPDLLVPTAIYTRTLLALRERVAVHAAAHVTGGGIAGNLERVLPDGCGARVDGSRWSRPGWMDLLASLGIAEDELRSTFNAGLGMLVVTPDPDGALAVVTADGTDAWVVGEITSGAGIDYT